MGSPFWPSHEPSGIGGQLYAIAFVQGENGNRGAAALRAADDQRSVKPEMARPALATRMEKTHDFAGLRVDPGEIWAFMVVIVMTGQRKIVRIVAAAVLLRDNVLDMEAIEWLVVLMDSAVLAAVAGAAPDQFAGLGVHPLPSETFKSRRAFAG
jgi:hypothetical protein